MMSRSTATRRVSRPRSLAFVVSALLVVSLNSLAADIVFLNNDKRVEGYAREEGDEIVVETLEGKVLRFKRDEVKRVRYDYFGAAVCLREKQTPEKEDCSGVLHELSEGRVITATKDRKSRKRVYRLRELKSLEVKREGRFQKIIPLLRKDLKITLRVKDGDGERSVEGVVKKVDRSLLVFESTNGEELELREPMLIGAYYEPPKAVVESPNRFRWWYIFPGLPQYSRDEFWKGTGIVGGFALLGGAFAAEYSAAVKANNSAKSDPVFLFFGVNNYQASFQSHQNNQKAIGGIAALLYIYHLFDAGLFSGLFGGDELPGPVKGTRPGEKKAVTLESRSYFRPIGNARGDREVVNEVLFSFRF